MQGGVLHRTEPEVLVIAHRILILERVTSDLDLRLSNLTAEGPLS